MTLHSSHYYCLVVQNASSLMTTDTYHKTPKNVLSHYNLKIPLVLDENIMLDRLRTHFTVPQFFKCLSTTDPRA